MATMNGMTSIQEVEQKSEEISRTLKAIGNQRRLVILCQLVSNEEMSVTALTAAIGLGQSALSQHLALMREEGIVDTRRDGQTIYYRVSDDRVRELMKSFHHLYCEMPDKE